MSITLEQFSYFAQSGKKTVYDKPVNLDNFFGTVAAACKFQVHNTAAEPSAGRVPEIEFVMTASGSLPGWFSSVHEQAFTTGLTFVTSSTSGTYTAQATSFDIWGAVEGNKLDTSALTTVTISSDVSFQIWANAASSNRRALQDITIVNGEGIKVYPMVYYGTAGADGSYPNLILAPIAIGATATYRFGQAGLTAGPAIGGNTPGLAIVLSDNSQLPKLKASTGLGSSVTAHYKTGLY